MNEPSLFSKANGPPYYISSGPWVCYLKLSAHSFPAKRDRHNQPGKVVQ